MARVGGAARFDGWRIVGLGALLHALGFGLIGAYGLVATPLIEEFGATPTQLGLGMSISIACTAVLGAALGPLLDRGPLRAIMLAGVALMLGSLLAVSRGSALGELAVGFALGTVGMSMYSLFPAQVMIVNWFVLRRGTALSLAAVGMSVASFIVPPLTAWLIDALGWRDAVAALACGAALLVAPAIARLAVKRPEEVGQQPDGLALPRAEHPGAAGATAASLVEVPLGRLLVDRNFWLVGIGIGLALCVSVASLFLVRHLEELGIPRTRAALVPSLSAVFGALGKLLAGWLADRLDQRAVAIGALSLHGLGWLIVATQSGLGAMLIAAVPLGLGGGGFLPLPPVLQGSCFGRASIGRVSGLHALLGLPFLLSVAPAVGWGAARGGGFAAPFLGLIGALALAALVLGLLRIPRAEPQPLRSGWTASAPRESGA
jgi:MFS family permease